MPHIVECGNKTGRRIADQAIDNLAEDAKAHEVVIHVSGKKTTSPECKKDRPQE